MSSSSSSIDTNQPPADLIAFAALVKQEIKELKDGERTHQAIVSLLHDKSNEKQFEEFLGHVNDFAAESDEEAAPPAASAHSTSASSIPPPPILPRLDLSRGDLIDQTMDEDEDESKMNVSSTNNPLLTRESKDEKGDEDDDDFVDETGVPKGVKRELMENMLLQIRQSEARRAAEAAELEHQWQPDGDPLTDDERRQLNRMIVEQVMGREAERDTTER